MPGHWFLRLVAFLVALGIGVESQAAEPWADVNLPEVAGLHLWLDASSKAARCAADGLRQLESGEPLSMWHDASGAKRHALQADPLK